MSSKSKSNKSTKTPATKPAPRNAGPVAVPAPQTVAQSETVAETVVDNAAASAVTSEPSTVVSAAADAPPAQGAQTMISLRLVRTKPNGSAVYQIPGVAGTARIAKAMFGGNAPPTELNIASEGLAAMDPVKAQKLAAKADRRAKSTETAQTRLEKLTARAALHESRAAKAKVRIEKATARLAKAQAKAGVTPAPEGTVAETPAGAAPETEMAGAAV